MWSIAMDIKSINANDTANETSMALDETALTVSIQSASSSDAACGGIS